MDSNKVTFSDDMYFRCLKRAMYCFNDYEEDTAPRKKAAADNGKKGKAAKQAKKTEVSPSHSIYNIDDKSMVHVDTDKLIENIVVNENSSSVYYPETEKIIGIGVGQYIECQVISG